VAVAETEYDQAVGVVDRGRAPDVAACMAGGRRREGRADGAVLRIELPEQVAGGGIDGEESGGVLRRRLVHVRAHVDDPVVHDGRRLDLHTARGRARIRVDGPDGGAAGGVERPYGAATTEVDGAVLVCGRRQDA